MANQSRIKKGAVPYSIAVGMNIDFRANDFVNWCVLSPHVADGFVLVFVTTGYFFFMVASYNNGFCVFFLFSLNMFGPGTAAPSNKPKTRIVITGAI